MKTSTYKYFLLFGFLGFLIACSTKKNSFVNRNFHAVTTEYNVLYNGGIALQAGIDGLKTSYQDNYWDILPVERMVPVEEGKEKNPADTTKNQSFARAETKAIKAIQKHSMNIANSEKNPQMDEAHLLLGKARYYDNRFIPALEAFNYILYKHPNSDKINEAKVWREKTNIRLENEGVAIKNLKMLVKDKELLDQQVYADANASLAQAYINTGSLDSATVVLRRAVESTKINEEEARYRFILGQLYGKLNYPDSSYAAYQQVIDMKRRSPRRYVIQAHAMQAGQFDYKGGDTLAFMEKYRDLLKDRENRPYLDIINHQVALFYDKQEMDAEAVTYYNKSLRAKSQDKYLTASNYRNIAEINFENAKYPTAGMYYDSTMVYLNNRGREYKNIKKKRDNLADVIKYEAIAQANDSILHVVSLSDDGKKKFYEDYIVRLKAQEEAERRRQEAEAQRQANLAAAGNYMGNSANTNVAGNTIGNNGVAAKGNAGRVQTPSASLLKNGKANIDAAPVPNPSAGNAGNSGNTSNMGGSTAGSGGKFYFYTPSTVAYGKLEFKRLWGDRPYANNWRWSAEISGTTGDTDSDTATDSMAVATKGDQPLDPRYTPEFYIRQLPISQVVLDSLAKERNFAYYQLGSIYKDKFKEYQRAADKLEKLLQNNPEERLVLPSKYNLYKIYEIIDPAKAEKYKNQILNEYPDSRYAEIIRNPNIDAINNASPEAVYAALYKQFEQGQVREALSQAEQHIDTYTGEEIVSKFELLKARIVGRLQGLEDYKKTLNYVALTYPNSAEGKEAEAMLKTDIPALEKLTFGRPAVTWKIIFKFENPNDPAIKPLTDKIQKFIKDGLNNNITLSNDIYTMNSNFIVIHGFNSRLAAVDAVTILKDYKTYKIAETPVIISSEDYKVVQVKKNFTEFLAIE